MKEYGKMDKMTYVKGFNKTYTYTDDDNNLCSFVLSSDGFPVSVYTYSNVDSFGAQCLCWQNANLSNALTTKAKAFSNYSKISTDVIADMASIGNSGWMSVNSRSLIPN